VSEGGLLGGASVVEIGQGLAAGYCSMLLADAGARVVRVSLVDSDAVCLALDRGKRRVVLQSDAAESRIDLDRLVAAADVVLGDLSTVGPGRDGRRITASITLWGDASEHAEGIIAEAESTLLGASRRTDGTPQAFGFPLAEVVSGLACYAAVVSALYRRQRTGRGDHIAISMVNTLLALNSINITGAQIPAEPGYGTAAYGIFETADSHVVLGVNSDRLWGRLCQSMKRPDLAADPRYATYLERDRRVPEVNAIVAEWAAQRTSAEIVERVGPSGVPVGQVASPDDVLRSEPLSRVGYVWDVDDGAGGTLKVPANPLGMDSGSRRIAPACDDAEQILHEFLGIDRADYEELRRSGAFGPSGALTP
jgi:crotonobetainyl-CoA:carnitine CoA-transferase CaiB-like acyl-CoA transferase